MKRAHTYDADCLSVCMAVSVSVCVCVYVQVVRMSMFVPRKQAAGEAHELKQQSQSPKN